MLQEECAELIQAVNKYWRKMDYAPMNEVLEQKSKLVEEMADVQNMLMQELYLLGVDPKIFHEKMMYKLDRQLERLKEYE